MTNWNSFKAEVRSIMNQRIEAAKSIALSEYSSIYRGQNETYASFNERFISIVNKLENLTGNNAPTRLENGKSAIERYLDAIRNTEFATVLRGLKVSRKWNDFINHMRTHASQELQEKNRNQKASTLVNPPIPPLPGQEQGNFGNSRGRGNRGKRGNYRGQGSRGNGLPNRLHFPQQQNNQKHQQQINQRGNFKGKGRGFKNNQGFRGGRGKFNGGYNGQKGGQNDSNSYENAIHQCSWDPWDNEKENEHVAYATFHTESPVITHNMGDVSLASSVFQDGKPRGLKDCGATDFVIQEGFIRKHRLREQGLLKTVNLPHPITLHTPNGPRSITQTVYFSMSFPTVDNKGVNKPYNLACRALLVNDPNNNTPILIPGWLLKKLKAVTDWYTDATRFETPFGYRWIKWDYKNKLYFTEIKFGPPPPDHIIPNPFQKAKHTFIPPPPPPPMPQANAYGYAIPNYYNIPTQNRFDALIQQQLPLPNSILGNGLTPDMVRQSQNASMGIQLASNAFVSKTQFPRLKPSLTPTFKTSRTWAQVVKP